MKLRKKTKKKLRIGFALIMILMMLLPLFQYFIPSAQDSNQKLLDAYVESLKDVNNEDLALPEPELEGTCVVSEIVDGDTIKVIWGSEERTVNLIGIEAYEKKKNKATDEYLAELIDGQHIGLEFDAEKEDANGNLLAYAYLENMTQINELLIAEGYAKYVPNNVNTKYYISFEAAENRAKEL